MKHNKKITDISELKVGDEVVFWNDDNLSSQDKNLLGKGEKYVVTIVDEVYDMVALKGIERLYQSENTEYIIGWEFWRFFLPK